MQVDGNDSKLVKMATWLANHPDIQRRLCDGEYPVTPEEFIEVMELLERNGFYELIVVLAFKNRYGRVLEQAMRKLLIEKAGKEWERIGTEQMCKEMKDKIRAEIHIKNEGANRLG